MKVKFMSLVIAAVIFVSCGTTYTTTSNNAAYNVSVPSGVTANFAAQYPDATNIVWNSYDLNTVPIDWEMTGWDAMDAKDFTVSFDMGSNKYYAWYDSNGMLVGSAFAVTDYSKLPYAVNTLIENKYKGYTIESAQREMWKSQTAYELKLVQGENRIKLLVDSNGNILKEKLK